MFPFESHLLDIFLENKLFFHFLCLQSNLLYTLGFFFQKSSKNAIIFLVVLGHSVKPDKGSPLCCCQDNVLVPYDLNYLNSLVLGSTHAIQSSFLRHFVSDAWILSFSIRKLTSHLLTAYSSLVYEAGWLTHYFLSSSHLPAQYLSTITLEKVLIWWKW